MAEASNINAVAAARTGAVFGGTDKRESDTQEANWKTFALVDTAGLPVGGYPYRFVDSGGVVTEGVLRRDGMVCRDGLAEGPCTVTVMHVSRAWWTTEEARADEPVGLSARVTGFPDGTAALFIIFRRDVRGPDVKVDEIKTAVQDGAVAGEWMYGHVAVGSQGKLEDLSRYAAPTFYFEAVVGPAVARSGELTVRDYIEIRLKDRYGRPLTHAEYVLTLSDGTIRRGRVDAGGYGREENVPPAPWHLHVLGLQQ